MIKQFNANKARLRRHGRMRNRLAGSQVRPRLNVFRSGRHIYAQIIDDTNGRTLAAASSIDESLRNFNPTPAASIAESRTETTEAAPVEMAAEVAPAKVGRHKKVHLPQEVESRLLRSRLCCLLLKEVRQRHKLSNLRRLRTIGK